MRCLKKNTRGAPCCLTNNSLMLLMKVWSKIWISLNLLMRIFYYCLKFFFISSLLIQTIYFSDGWKNVDKFVSRVSNRSNLTLIELFNLIDESWWEFMDLLDPFYVIFIITSSHAISEIINQKIWIWTILLVAHWI